MIRDSALIAMVTTLHRKNPVIGTATQSGRLPEAGRLYAYLTQLRKTEIAYHPPHLNKKRIGQYRFWFRRARWLPVACPWFGCILTAAAMWENRG